MTTATLPYPSRRRIAVRIAMLLGCFTAAAASGLASAAGTAGTTPELPSVVVRFTDLDLATDQGVRSLYTRIVRAAHTVCPDAPIRDLNASAQSRACQQQAIARAVREVNTPLLATVYANHWKHS